MGNANTDACSINPDSKPSGVLVSTHAGYADVVKWRNDVCQRLSDYLRGSGVGILVFCWGLLTADKGFAQAVCKGHSKWIILTAFVAASALFIDLMHFVFSFIVSDKLKLEMEREKLESKPYPTKSFMYRAVYVCFWTKLTLIPLAFGSVIVLLLVSLQ
ncbi:MAG: hypothetical protein ABSF70_06230 [Terracidiphilus sp.]|jgi:hypothetical protein